MVSIITERNDIGRTAANLQETQLNTGNVNSGSFGKLFERAVDGHIYAQPLYLPGVNIPGPTPRDVVYVGDDAQQRVRFDAHDPAIGAPTGTALWSRPALCLMATLASTAACTTISRWRSALSLLR